MKNKNTNILITGITGFLGSLIAKNLIHTDAYRQGSIKIIGLARNIEKAQVQFADYDMRNVSFHSVDITDKDKMFSIFKEQHIDYMIHCAAATASSYMVSHPIETADGIVLGTRNMLELARRMQVKSMVYLSSMEAYGRVTDIGRPRKEEASLATRRTNTTSPVASPRNASSSAPISNRLSGKLSPRASRRAKPS